MHPTSATSHALLRGTCAALPLPRIDPLKRQVVPYPIRCVSPASFSTLFAVKRDMIFTGTVNGFGACGLVQTS